MAMAYRGEIRTTTGMEPVTRWYATAGAASRQLADYCARRENGLWFPSQMVRGRERGNMTIRELNAEAVNERAT